MFYDEDLFVKYDTEMANPTLICFECNADSTVVVQVSDFLCQSHAFLRKSIENRIQDATGLP